MSDLVVQLDAALQGRYRIERELGEGGMARVYVAEDLRHDRLVALKVLRPEVAEAVGVERFEREIRITARLHHPHILPVYDSGIAAGHLFYVMPFVEGESLAARLAREGRLPLDQALAIVSDVADALDHAHAAGVVHRDIKPANILLKGHHALVADFGIATAAADVQIEALTRTGSWIGTPPYMSPEQIEGRGEVGPPSDVYSLACVLFQILTGARPFEGDSLQSVLAGHLTVEPPSVRAVRDDVPAGIDQAIRSALAKTPDARPSTPAAFMAALTDPTRPGLQRPRRLAVLTAAGVATAAMLVFTPWVSRAPSGELLANPRESIMVLPFDVLSDDGSLDWLREASVSLLSLALEGWDEVRVVDRLRLAGLAQQQAIALDRALSLDDGLRLARAAGVGTLVLGEIIGQGGEIDLAARLYDVSTESGVGPPMRATQPADGDLRGLFDDIAAGILGLSGAASVSPDIRAASTRSLSAYQEFEAGLRHLYRSELTRAEERFRAATETDTTFALAFHYLALANYWNHHRSSILPEWAESTRQAVRFGTELPERRRMHVQALNAQMNRDFETARGLYVQLLDEDETDVEARLQLGDIEYHDEGLTRTTEGRLRPRANWNAAVEHFVRATETDTRFHLGYGHYFDIYLATIGGGCRTHTLDDFTPSDAEELSDHLQVFTGVSVADGAPGEFELLVFSACGADTIEWRAPNEAPVARALALEDLAPAKRLALRWVAAAPDIARPQAVLADILRLERDRSPAHAFARTTGRYLAALAREVELSDSPDTRTLLRVGDLHASLGQPDSARHYWDRAVEPLSYTTYLDSRRGRLRPLPEGAQMSWLYAPNLGRDLAMWQPYTGYQDRLELLGDAGAEASTLSFLLDSLLTIREEPSFPAENLGPLVNSLTNSLTPSLMAVDTAVAMRWFELGDSIPTLWRAYLARRSDPEGSLAELRSAMVAVEYDLPRGDWPGEEALFLMAGLARELGADSLAVELYDRFDIKIFRPHVLQTRSYLLRARSYEALADTTEALRYYRLFAELWSESDPDLRHHHDEAIAAIRRLGG